MRTNSKYNYAFWLRIFHYKKQKYFLKEKAAVGIGFYFIKLAVVVGAAQEQILFK